MSRHDAVAPEAGKIESVANLRVSLALLRIYRNLELRYQELDLAAVARPFWHLLRRRPVLLLTALAGAPLSGSRRRRAYGGNDALKEAVERFCAERAGRRGHLPEEIPEAGVLEVIGEGLMRGDSRFSTLFDAIQADLEAQVARSRLPHDRNVALLTDLLGLSAAEKRFLLLAAAIQASTIGSSAFTIIGGTTRLVRAFQAVLTPANEHEVRGLMRRSSALVRSGLLDVETFGSRRDMEDVLRLSGQGTLLVNARAKTAADLSEVILKRLAAAPDDEPLAWPHLEERTELLQLTLARTLATRRSGVNILLHGAPGTGKTRYAQQLVARAGAHGFSVADTKADGDPAAREERLGSLLLTQVFAPPGRSIVVLDEAEDVFQAEYNNPLGRMFGRRDDSKAWINNLLDRNVHPVIWISNRIDHLDPAYLRRFTYCLEFPETPHRVRRDIVRRHLSPLGCSDGLLTAVAANPKVSPALVASAASFAQLASLSGAKADGAVTLMLGDMVRAMGSELQFQVAECPTRFDFRYLNARGAVAADAVTEALGRMGQGRLLLSGPPGTGKTQLAAEMARCLGRDLVYRTASDINSMWFGQSERNVARMFTGCDPREELLFLDEADTLLASRESSGQRAEVAVTSEFLRHLEAFRGVFICATNFGRRIDPAMLRRFEYRLELMPLSTAQREAMLRETALGWDGQDPQPELPHQILSRLQQLDQLTPGDFANVVRRVRALQLSLDAAGWVTELEAEHMTKPGTARAAMGFL